MNPCNGVYIEKRARHGLPPSGHSGALPYRQNSDTKCFKRSLGTWGGILLVSHKEFDLIHL